MNDHITEVGGMFRESLEGDQTAVPRVFVLTVGRDGSDGVVVVTDEADE